MLEVELLGHLHLTHDGRTVERVSNPRLFTYLILHRDRPRTRDEVAFTLWPESGDAQALTNLRRELHVLRHALPEPDVVLNLDGRTLQWRPDGPFRLDVLEFESAVERGRLGEIDALRGAIAGYGGDLVPGIYDDWIEPDRERLRTLYFEAIDALAERLEERREYREATALLRRRIETDALHEPAYRALMRVAAFSGDRSAGLQAYHACASVLQAELGVAPAAETRAAYEQLLALESGEAGLVQPPTAPPSHRLIGRATEWATLTAAWRRARSGTPTLVLVEGEAGIGKSRLIEELVTWTRAQGHAAVYARSYAAEGALAYAPVAVWLRAAPMYGAVARLDGPWRSEIARLLPELLAAEPALSSPEPMTESWQRQRLFEALLRAIRAARSPLLLVLDDAHWADRDTLEWLHYLLRAAPPLPVLVVVAARSEELTANLALMALVLGLRERAELDEIELTSLSEAETGELGADVAARPLEAAERTALYRETEGHPLVVVELARGGLTDLGAGSGRETDDDAAGRAASTGRIPPRMRAVIASRLEQLGPEARPLAELAATFGRDFSFEVLARASDLEEAALVHALDELWQRRIVRDRGLHTYDFSHDRIRDVAYAGIGPVRRRLLHRRVAQALELVHANDLDPVAGELAAHLEAAGQSAGAIESYERAATVASRISANSDSARYLLRALALLRQGPPSSERDRQELGLQLRMSLALQATDGYSSQRQEETLERARMLAETLDRPHEMMVALNGLSGVHIVRGHVREALALAEAALVLGGDDPDSASANLTTVAGSLLFIGESAKAIDRFEQAQATYAPGRSRPMPSGTDPGAFSLAWGSHALWLVGETRRALEWSGQAIARAEALAHPYTTTIAHAYAAILSQLIGDEPSMSEHASVAAAMCTRYQFAYYGEWHSILDAWAARDTASNGAERIEQALQALQSIRASARRPYYLTLLADVHLAAGRPDATLAAIDAALATAAASGERWWLPELHRRHGELTEGVPGERDIRRALELAEGQGNWSLALRAAISLTRRDPDETAVLASILERTPDPAERERAEATALISVSGTRV